MKNYKPLDKSWIKKAETEFIIRDNQTFYLQGVSDFRKKALEALEKFSVLTIDQPIIYNKKLYVSQEDVISLIEGLYSETKKTKKNEK